MDNLSKEIEISKKTIKLTKETMKHVKKLTELAKVCDEYDIPFMFHIENKTSLKEKNNDK